MLNKRNNLIGMGLLMATAAAPVIAGVYADNTATEKDTIFEDTSGLTPNVSVLKGGTYNIGDKVPESVHEENKRLILETDQVYKRLGESDFSTSQYETNSDKEMTKLIYKGSEDINIAMKKNGSDFFGYTADKKAREISFHQPLKKSDKLEITIRRKGYVPIVGDFHVLSEGESAGKWAFVRRGINTNFYKPPTDENGAFATPGLKKGIYKLEFPDGTIGRVEVPFYVQNQVEVTIEYREEDGRVLKTEKNVIVPYQEYLENVLSYPGRSIKSVDSPRASKKGQKIIVTLKSGTDYEPQVVVPTLKVGDQANEASYVKNLPDGATVRVIKKIDTSSAGVKEFELGITLAGQTEKTYTYIATVINKESPAGTEALQKEIEELKKQVRDKDAEINKLNEELNKAKAEGDKAKIAELENNIKTLNEDLNKEKQKTNDLQTKVNELTGKNSKLEKEKNKLQAELDSTKNELDAANKKAQNLTSELDNVKADLEAKNKTIKELNEKIADQDTRIKGLEGTVESLENDTAQLNKKIKEQEADIDSKSAEIERLKKQSSQSASEKDAEIAKLSSEVSAAKKEIAGLKADKEDLEKKLNDANAELSSVKSELETTKRALKVKEDEAAANKEEIEKLNKKLKASDEKVNELTENFSKLNSEKQTVDKKLQDADNKILGLNKQITELENAVKEKDQKIAELNNNIDKLNSDLEAANNNLDKKQKRHWFFRKQG